MARTQEELDLILSGLQVPYKRGSICNLGGAERASITLWLSLDPKESWSYGIYHNSRYFILIYDDLGVIELSSQGRDLKKKFRKCTVKNANHALEKISNYIFHEYDESAKESIS